MLLINKMWDHFTGACTSDFHRVIMAQPEHLPEQCGILPKSFQRQIHTRSVQQTGGTGTLRPLWDLWRDRNYRNLVGKFSGLENHSGWLRTFSEWYKGKKRKRSCIFCKRKREPWSTVSSSGPLVQKQNGQNGEVSQEVHEDDQRALEPVLWGKTEGASSYLL